MGQAGLLTLLQDAPQAIAAQLRLRATGGLVAIDVPRAAPAAMRHFSTNLAAALTDDPRHPEQLGRTNGGLLELRLHMAVQGQLIISETMTQAPQLRHS